MENKELELDNLSTMEWNVYNYLKTRSERGLWTSQEELTSMLHHVGYPNVNDRMTRRYVENIRKCDRIQKIILSGQDGYKIMTDIEKEKVYLERKRITALKKLKQYYRDIDRLNKDGQVRLTYDTNERDYIESLLKESE